MILGTAPEAVRTGGTYDEIETWAAPQLRAWQLERVRELTARVAAESGFYRESWAAAGVDGAALGDWDDFRRLPTVDKGRLVAAGDAWALRSGPVAFSTRGTSGEPLVVSLDREESESYLRPTMRGFWWAGFRAGETALMMSPAWHRLAAMEGHSVMRMGGRVAYFWGSGGPQYADSFVEALTNLRPEFVTTTAPFLISLVRRCDDAGVDARELFASVHSIVVVGLPLTRPLRAFLSERTGAEVFERSGTQEGAAADECEDHSAPHVHADVCHLEVLDEHGDPVSSGTRGRLVVTKLEPVGDPVVRYDTGDVAALFDEPCACGRLLPRLKIYGRPESSVVVDGRAITAYDVRTCVDADPRLVGRLVLLVRDRGAEDVLTVAIEGEAVDPDGIAERLHDDLGVERVRFSWLGQARMAWGFRQVVDGSEV